MDFIAGGVGTGRFLEPHGRAGKELSLRPSIARLAFDPLGEQPAKKRRKARIRLRRPDPGFERHFFGKCDRHILHDTKFVFHGFRVNLFPRSCLR